MTPVNEKTRTAYEDEFFLKQNGNRGRREKMDRLLKYITEN